MSVNFIIGKSGSGKTYNAFNMIINMSLQNPDKRFFIIVPDQACLSAQKKLMKLHQKKATFNIDVTTFKRLAHKLCAELGIDATLELSDTVKNILLRKVLLENEDELKLWKNKYSNPEFIDKIRVIIDEFYKYQVDEKLELIKEDKVSRQLAQKINDLSIIAKKYYKEIDLLEERKIAQYKASGLDDFYCYDILELLSKCISRSNLVKNAIILFDDFTGFSNFHYDIINSLMLNNCDLYFNLGMDASYDFSELRNKEAVIDKEDIFYMPKYIYMNISKMAIKNNVDIGEDVLLNGNFRHDKNSGLYYLNDFIIQYYGDRNKEADKNILSNSGIKVYRCLNAGLEIKNAVNKISHLIKNEGYSYKDIAVVLPDMDTYAFYLCNELKNNGLEYYIDETAELNNNLISLLISGAYNIVRSDFSYVEVISFVKNPFFIEYLKNNGISENQIYNLDNLMYQGGFRGEKLFSKKELSFLPKCLEKIDEEERKELIKLINLIYRVVKDIKNIFIGNKNIRVGNAVSKIRNLLSVFCNDDSIEKINNEYKEFSFVTVTDYYKCRKSIEELLDNMDEIIGKKLISSSEFYDILAAAIFGFKFGKIPAKSDQIIVGDFIRTRVDDKKAVFILGMNEGKIPVVMGDERLLSDREKIELRDNDIVLSPTIYEDYMQQNYYLYLWLNKPSHMLYMSYSCGGKDGETLYISDYLSNIKKFFSIKDKDILSLSDMEEIYSLYEAKDYIAFNIKAENNDKRLLSVLSSVGDEADKFIDAVTYVYKDNRLPKKLALELFGKNINLSVTRLERFFDCPYAHFIKYGIKLRDREAFKLKDSDKGNFIHDVLYNVFDELINTDCKILKRNISEEDFNKFIDNNINKLDSKDYINLYNYSHINNYLFERYKRKIKDKVLILLYQLKKSRFMPFKLEYEFEENIENGIGVNSKLVGKIDRIDVYKSCDINYIKIIDYKTGNKELDTVLMSYGKQLQLPLYMNIISRELSHNNEKAYPAGIFYQNLEIDKFISVEGLYGKNKNYNFEKLMLNKINSCEYIDKEPNKDGLCEKIITYNRLEGFVLKDDEVVSAMDIGLSPDSSLNTSDILQVKYKKDKSFYKNSKVLELEDFIEIIDNSEKICRDIFNEIYEGDIKVSPYAKLNGKDKIVENACKFCKYKAVCRFDEKEDGFKYNEIKTAKSRK